MNIIIVLRFDTPFPKKAVQRYDKKIKNMTSGRGNVLIFFLHFLVPICLSGIIEGLSNHAGQPFACFILVAYSFCLFAVFFQRVVLP